MKRIVIFASGSGSNAENIIKYFENSEDITVSYVLTNNKNAKVLERCERLKVPSLVFNRDDFNRTEKIVSFLKKEADFIVLAGFLWKIPVNLVTAFPNKMINIHPALLPKYGGKGMYGKHVHEAVKENSDAETGITIHFVNEHYDQGAIIFQASVAVNANDSVDDIAQKVHELEYKYFPEVIEKVILNEEIE